ncbi:MAG TPA: LLM class flavin-dependent oxidoreductase [Spirillospora sp.]
MARKQIHLAAHFPGVNNTTVWSDPASGSQIDFASFVHLAQTAERGRFDFFFLAEGLRLREMKGRIHELDVAGRPESLTVLSALAAVTSRLGLAATVDSTFNEPYEVARRPATLDHLSGGRAAWNVVTSWDAFTGEYVRAWPACSSRTTSPSSVRSRTGSRSCGREGPSRRARPARSGEPRHPCTRELLAAIPGGRVRTGGNEEET